MSKLFLLCLIVSILLVPACRKSKRDHIADNTPGCIREKIRHEARQEYGLSKVDEYLFNNQVVYALVPSQRIADASTEIKRPDCSTLCFVGGFVAGSQRCDGRDFNQAAVFQRNIWKR